MSTVPVRWKAWHGDEVTELRFPASWAVEVCRMAGAPPLAPEEIGRAFRHPIGAPPLEVLARGRRSVAIAVDDLTRPTPTSGVLRPMLQALDVAGVARDRITVIVACGAHGDRELAGLAAKLGPEVLRDCRVVWHDPRANLVEVGIAFDGIPVRLNREFLEADLKMSIGCITPHPFAGFSGGGKMVLPGLASLEVIERTHRYAVMGLRGGFGVVDGNEFRQEVEEVCRKCDLELIADVVVNESRETAGVFVGDPGTAFRSGVEFARRVYATPLPGEVDVAVMNAYPKDTDLIQSENALNLVRASGARFVREGGVVVLLAAASGGVGAHGLFSPGGRLHRRPVRKAWLGRRDLAICSPGVGAERARDLFWSGYPFFGRWDEAMEALERRLGERCRVAVFPSGSIQIGA